MHINMFLTLLSVSVPSEMKMVQLTSLMFNNWNNNVIHKACVVTSCCHFTVHMHLEATIFAASQSHTTINKLEKRQSFFARRPLKVIN